ncbi:hypothetical protein ACFXJ5_01500 [Streptomyces sp. NPDC059373]
MPNRTRAALRAAVTVTSVAAALASAGVATAHAANDANDLKAAAAGSHQAGQAVVGTVKYLPINPLAHTGVNPLDNSLGSQVADFKPVSTAMVTGPLADSRSVSELPLIGNTVKKLQAG